MSLLLMYFPLANNVSLVDWILKPSRFLMSDCITWPFACLVVTQLPPVIAATAVHAAVPHHKQAMVRPTAHVGHLLALEAHQFPGQWDLLLLNATQPQLAMDHAAPAQHGGAWGSLLSILSLLAGHSHTGLPLKSSLPHSWRQVLSFVMMLCHISLWQMI